AFAEHDLKEMGARVRGTEHFRTRYQIRAPHPAKTLVEPARIESLDLFPVAVEALGPRVQRVRIMAAQILDVDNLQTAVLHCVEGFGEARDPAAREHVLADVELGVARADVADEMQHA